jgi:[acyl-carrier-protein] S-malonyltransferase
MKTAYAFPGVGVPPCGAEGRFFEAHRGTMAPLLERAGERAGADLVGPLVDGEADRLPDRTQQFFTYAYSVGVAEVFADQGVAASMVGGYSFGIYGALRAAGAVSFDDGLAVLERAYRVMEQAAPPGSGMAVVVGLTREEVEGMLAGDAFPSVALTTTSSDTCQVVSGRDAALARFCAAALAADALSADPLDVRIPYHHPELLAGASEEMGRFLEAVPFAAARVPVISSIDQRPLAAAGDLKRLVAENLTTPICWRRVVGAFHEAGVRRVAECGPGVSLTRNGAFMPFDDIEYTNVKKAARSLGR